jgi:hypothetical protein
MRSTSAALAVLIVLAMISISSAFEGNQIHLRNYLGAGATDFGRVDQHAGNMIIVCGDGNYIDQMNSRGFSVSGQPFSGYKASNAALVIGQSNDLWQVNDPVDMQLSLRQINELMVIGKENDAYQSNSALGASEHGNVTVDVDQANFGIIFGEANSLVQANNASPIAYYSGTISQNESNAAYVYGINNGIAMENNLYASAFEGGMVNQTAKNLAFAITSGDEIVYVPPSSMVVLMPWENSSLQMPSFPDLPNLPSPPAWTSGYPMDP